MKKTAIVRNETMTDQYYDGMASRNKTEGELDRLRLWRPEEAAQWKYAVTYTYRGTPARWKMFFMSPRDREAFLYVVWTYVENVEKFEIGKEG
jgi:hypothetical protein